MAWTAPRTWVAAETLTAALLNAELRDNLLAGFPTGSLHYYIRAATTTETLINSFALECNATQVSRTTYAALNTLLSSLSYPFGSGNGSSTFTLPSLEGRSLASMASGGHTDVNALGDSDGLAKANRAMRHGHTGVVHDHLGTGLTTTANEIIFGSSLAAGTSYTWSSATVSGTTTPQVADSGVNNFGNTAPFLVAGIYAVKV